MTTTEQEQPSVREQIDAETIKLMTNLRLEGKTMREIAKETGVSLGVVGKHLKGIEPGTNEKANNPELRGPQYVPVMISKEHSAKLYALAIDEGYQSVEEFLEKSMLPWYRVKRDFEWKLRMKVEPKTFQLYLEGAITDSIELSELRKKIQNMAPATPTQQTMITIPAGGPRI